MHRVLFDALDGLLSTAEAYYKTRGTRQITRPIHIKETFERCADSICQKMSSYDKQTRQFHKDSLTEFHKQVQITENLIAKLPIFSFGKLYESSKQEIFSSMNSIEKKVFLRNWHDIEIVQKDRIKKLLRPTMGHPGNAEKFKSLLLEEENRVSLAVTLIHDVHRRSISSLQSLQTSFFQCLAEEAKWYLLSFDNIIVQSDIHKPEVYPLEQPKYEEKTHRETEESKNPKPNLSTFNLRNTSLNTQRRQSIISKSGVAKDKISLERKVLTKTIEIRPEGATWPGLKFHPADNCPFESFVTDAVKTKKKTMCHKIVIAERNKFMMNFIKQVAEIVENLNTQRDNRLKLVETWTEQWQKDVESVKSLF